MSSGICAVTFMTLRLACSGWLFVFHRRLLMWKRYKVEFAL